MRAIGLPKMRKKIHGEGSGGDSGDCKGCRNDGIDSVNIGKAGVCGLEIQV